MQSHLHNSDTQSKYNWSVVNTCNNNNRNNTNISQQLFVNTINHCHDNNNNINQNNISINNATTSQIEPARFASNMSYNNKASTNNALSSQTAANNIRNTINNMNNNNIFDVMKRNSFINDNTNQEQTEMLRSSRVNDGNSNNTYYIMHQEGNNNNMYNNEHNNINDHFTLHSNHVIDLQSKNSQTCQKQNRNENISTSTSAAVRESDSSNTSNNKINNNKCNEISVAESNTTVLPAFNGDAILLQIKENHHSHDIKLTPHQNEDDNNIMKDTPHSDIPSPVHCKTNHLQSSPSETEKINEVTSSATENTTPVNTIVIPLKNISFANTPSKAPNTQSLSSLSSSILCNVQETASPGTTITAAVTGNKENCNNNNSNVNKVDNHNANCNVTNQANPQLLQNTQLMYLLPSSLPRSTNTNQQVNNNVKINNICLIDSSSNNNNNMNSCNYALNCNNVNNQNVLPANMNTTAIQNMPIRELSHANTNTTSVPSPAATASQTLSQNNIIPQNVLSQLTPAQLCALAHSLNISKKHQPQQPQGQSLSFAAQPVVLVNPSLLTSHTSLQPQMPCQLMSRSCLIPAAQMGINANILHSNTAVGINHTNQNIITTNDSNNNNRVSSTNNNNSVASQNELLMKMLLERQRQVTASVNTQVLQQEILPTHHRCNGTGYVLHCLYEGTVKRYNPVRGFGFLTATVQLIEIDKAKVQELLMVLKQPPLVQSTPEALLNNSTNQMTRIQEVQNGSLDYGSNLNKVSNECTRNNCSGNVNKDNTSTIPPISEEPYRYYLRHPVCLGDIFVHQSYLQMHGFRSLPIGGRVRFRAEQFNNQNALHATDVELLPQIIPSEVMRKLQQGEKEAQLLQCINRMNIVNQQVCNIATINNTSAININDRCRTMNAIDNSNNNNNMSITADAAALQNNLNSTNSTNVTAFQDTSMLHRNKCISTVNTSHINGVGGDESVSTLGLSYTVKEISQSNDVTHNNYNNNNNNCKAESTMISNQCNNATNCANDLCWLDSANYASVLCDDFIDNDSDNESINSFNCDIDFNCCEWTGNEEKL